MSWRRDDRHDRWEDRRRSPDRRRDVSRDRFHRHDRKDRYYEDRRRERHRERSRHRSPKEDEMPTPPSPPKISSPPRSRSCSSERQERITVTMTDCSYEDKADSHPDAVSSASPGDWICKCGSYNFKRRQFCYKRNCDGTRKDGPVIGVDAVKEGTAGITKRLLFRKLDALTTEESILDALKERCSKSLLDSIVGITIGKETLTGVSKCLAFINFSSITDSASALSELVNLQPPLVIDDRHVQISYYNEPTKPPKQAKPDYASYYNYSASQALSEADRVNAAAAVAQSAISAANARHSWTPVSAPTFTSSTSQSTQPKNIPTGDGTTVYSAPDVRTFQYDETSGYYYDPGTGLYYDGNTQYFYNNQTSQYMYWDSANCTYKAASQASQNTDQPKLPNPPDATTENTIVKEPEEKKKKDKEDKVKVAKKIAKDMERWARTLNQKKENAKSNVVMEQVLDTSSSKGSADIGFSVLGAGPSIIPRHTIEASPPKTEEFLLKNTEDLYESDEGIIDWAKLTCLLCKRKFPSADVLTKHKTMSDLHKQNLAEYQKSNETPQTNGYRDRAAERRLKFGEDDPPPIRKRFEPKPQMAAPVSQPPPSVVDTIGGKMLQKMGWSQGRGLGKEEQGRIAPIEAEQRPSLVGLGQKRGIYTPTPGETYRDTVKKLMIARYKEVAGQDDDA